MPAEVVEPHKLPSGWVITKVNESIVLLSPSGAGCVVEAVPTCARTIPEAVLYELASSLLSGKLAPV